MRGLLNEFKPDSYGKAFMVQPENVTIAVGTAVIGFWKGIAGWLMLVAIAFMVLDFITGLSAAFLTGVPSSLTALKGVVKKFLFACMMVMGLLLDAVVSLTGITINDIPLGAKFPITIAVSCWVIGVEGLSNLENINRAGVPTPSFLKSTFRRMREQGNPKKRGGQKLIGQ